MPSRWSGRRARFRSIINGSACVHPASVHDPLGGRIAQDLGFECGMFAGSTASLTVLGAPDLITLTLTEFAEQAHRIMVVSDRLGISPRVILAVLPYLTGEVDDLDLGEGGDRAKVSGRGPYDSPSSWSPPSSAAQVPPGVVRLWSLEAEAVGA